MKVILLSGGSGKRLWPMSNDSRSKQFLRVLSTSDGRRMSMVQRVYEQLSRFGLAKDTYICASKAQSDMIFAQLGDVQVILEPSRRDTFPAISLATLYLLDHQLIEPDEVIVVMPIDLYVEDDFFELIASLQEIYDSSMADLVLVGVTPSSPSSQYGYISVDRESSKGMQGFNRIHSFIEKPSTLLAVDLVNDGSLWNCGIFTYTASYLRECLLEGGYPNTYVDILDEFECLPAISFDYEVVESSKSMVAVTYSGSWKDLGTWGALTQEVGLDFAGSGVALHCERTHVINELGIPLVVMGMNDAVVVATPDGILVADKDESIRIKDVVGAFSGRPMYEERAWGNYRVLDFSKLEDGTEVLTRSVELFAEKNISYQRHFLRSEVWTIVDGEGEMIIDTRVISVRAGDVVRVFPNQWHSIRAKSALRFIEVQRGIELIEEDIERRFFEWDEIISHCSLLA